MFSTWQKSSPKHCHEIYALINIDSIKVINIWIVSLSITFPQLQESPYLDIYMPKKPKHVLHMMGKLSYFPLTFIICGLLNVAVRSSSLILMTLSLNLSSFVHESPKKGPNYGKWQPVCDLLKSSSKKSHLIWQVAAHILLWRVISYIKLSMVPLSHMNSISNGKFRLLTPLAVYIMKESF